MKRINIVTERFQIYN